MDLEKGHKGLQKCPPFRDAGPIKDTYLQAIQTSQHDCEHRSNWDEHCAHQQLYPRDTQVPIAGIDNKHHITMVLASTPAGHLLPPQVVYAGTL